jgi:hypothetical protein
MPAPTLDYVGVVSLPFYLTTVLCCKRSGEDGPHSEIKQINDEKNNAQRISILFGREDKKIDIIFLPNGMSLMPGGLTLPDESEILVLEYISDSLKKKWVITDKDIEVI